MHIVYLTFKVVIDTTLPIQVALQDISSECYYDIAGTETVHVLRSEMMAASLTPPE